MVHTNTVHHMLYLTIKYVIFNNQITSTSFLREDNQRGAAELIIARRTFAVVSIHKQTFYAWELCCPISDHVKKHTLLECLLSNFQILACICIIVRWVEEQFSRECHVVCDGKKRTSQKGPKMLSIEANRKFDLSNSIELNLTQSRD